VNRPILLDLFCGAGGASVGYSRAGFDVIGVDINPQPNYPFQFIQADWEEPLWVLPGLWERNKIPFLIHASPPCQAYSSMTKRWGRSAQHPDLVSKVRERLIEIDSPYVIENVLQAPLINPTVLCGSMFNLGVQVGTERRQLRRHRGFESNLSIPTPVPCIHMGRAIGVYGHSGGVSKRDGITFSGTDSWREAMGIPWMTGKELSESIPPAYTEYIGKLLINSL
jgi:DNA (cytosine-5)-methyltransferase 1